MKKLLSFLLMLLPSFAQAQSNSVPPPQPLNLDTPGLTIDSIVQYLQNGLTDADSGEGGRASQIAEFSRVWRDRAFRNDSSGVNMFQQYFRASSAAALARANTTCNGGNFSGKWRIDGPDSFPTQNLGRMRDVWVDPNDTTKLLASSEGGVWKSIDAGKHWRCITDNAPVLSGIISPCKIAVNPTNTDNIYVGSYTYKIHVINPQGLQGLLNNTASDYGHGLLVTTDGGNTWHQEVLAFNTPPDWKDKVSGAKPYFAPDGQRVYSFRADHLFYKTVSGNWQDITPTSLLGGSSRYFYELKFGRTATGNLDANHFFLVSHGLGRLIECFYNPTTQTHSFTRILFPTSAMDTSVDGFYISVPTSNILYAAFGSQLYKYDLSTATWTFMATTVDVWEGGFEASPANPSNIYLTRFFGESYFSNDIGNTNTQISTYSGNPTHTDVRSVYIQSTTNTTSGVNDRVYFACDGGIFMKPKGVNPIQNGVNTCVNINGKGLACGKYWGVSSLEKDGTVFAGMADNHQWSYNPAWSKPWQKFGDGDGGEAVASRVKEEGYVGYSGDGSTVNLRRAVPDQNGIYSSYNAGVYIGQEGKKPIVPLWADQYGGYYIGKNNLWRILPNSTTNTQVSGLQADPTYDVHLDEYKVNSVAKSIRCMSFSQYYANLTGYVMYEDGALFYRNDYGGNSQYIGQFNPKPKPNFLNSYPPTDIVCNPVHPERVWLSLGGIGDDAPHKRVVYSSDAGGNWFDISKGLPLKLPVVNIEYQEGSPYLYATTDIGMYRLDMTDFAYTDINDRMSAYHSVQWTCFNKGDVGNPDYPSINTPALNINYCSGRLYAATDGRGIWSTPLWEQFDVPPIEPSNIITQNTTWNTTRYLTSGIRIKNGATLTIAAPAKIHLPKDGQIRVEPGAKLIVDGATLTNGCKDCMWGGIVAEGKAYLPQSPANQATVIVQNGALIEHARNAITTWGGDLATAGAILNLSGSTFRNNKRSIEFISYHNQNNAGQRTGNLSRISRCTFETDDKYRGTGIGYFFSTFISLWDVEGVVISGNTFTNTNSSEANFGNGITSFNAAYQVRAACNSNVVTYPCTNITRNTFSGLRHGLFAEGDNSAIDQAASGSFLF